MPMPAANPSGGQRFMTPTSGQGVQPSSMQHGMEQSNPAHQASQVYSKFKLFCIEKTISVIWYPNGL
jgi:hypothetical protein